MELEILGGFLAVLAAVTTAGRYYYIRRTTHPRGVMYAMFVSFLIGSIFFVPISIILNYPNFGLSRFGAFIFVLAGALVPLIQGCDFEGTRRIGASRASPILMGYLLIASFIGVIFLGETVGALHGVGIIVLFCGVVMVSYESGENDRNSKSGFSLDLIFPLVAMLGAGIQVPLVSLGLTGGVPITIGLAINYSVSVAILGAFFKVRGWSLTEPFNVQEKDLYFGVSAAVISFAIFYFLALSIAPVSVVTPLRGTGPLFVLVISYLYLKKLETITKVLAFGVFLTVMGAMFVGVFM